MKRLLLICATLLPAFVMAADTYNVSCGVKKQKTQNDYGLSVSLKTQIDGDVDSGFTIRNYKLAYTVWVDDAEGKFTEEWTRETITGSKLNNDEKYDPDTYKKHVRFTMPSKQGKVELIYPEKLGKKKAFKAHVIFTNIVDHFGGTAHVYCTRTKRN